MRQKLAFVMRNKFLDAEHRATRGIPVDQQAIIAADQPAATSRRAAALVPDEAVETFGIAGSPEHCLQRLRDFIDAGIDEPVLSLVGHAGDVRLCDRRDAQVQGLTIMRIIGQPCTEFALAED